MGVTFEDLGRRFEPGQVMVTVTVTKLNGEVMASARRNIELTRSYPNGKSCDGDGYVMGGLKLNASDQI